MGRFPWPQNTVACFQYLSLYWVCYHKGGFVLFPPTQVCRERSSMGFAWLANRQQESCYDEEVPKHLCKCRSCEGVQFWGGTCGFKDVSGADPALHRAVPAQQHVPAHLFPAPNRGGVVSHPAHLQLFPRPSPGKNIRIMGKRKKIIISIF